MLWGGDGCLIWCDVKERLNILRLKHMFLSYLCGVKGMMVIRRPLGIFLSHPHDVKRDMLNHCTDFY